MRSSLRSSDGWKVEWDHELAKRAQAFANKCVFGHGLMTRCDGTVIGQNAAMLSSFTNGIKPGIEGWWAEAKDYNHSADKCSGVCGHYRQMAYSKVYKFGCGYKFCPTMTFQSSGIKRKNYYSYICNYDRAMPGSGKGIYKTGSSCTKCSKDHDSNNAVKCDRSSKTCSGTYMCKYGTCHRQCNMDRGVCSGHGIPDPNNGCKCKCDAKYSGKQCQCEDSFLWCAGSVDLCPIDKGTRDICKYTCRKEIPECR
ncbi:GLIPR1-like protein 1 [Tubulanus polymorphus]|uniref:GLIPR1-like protein 1 n=1 Tax=Tubulanus polymorphus TaxID=672921 RepID=UPI003DA68CB1